MVFKASVRREQRAPVLANAIVDLHPNALPLLDHTRSLSDWEAALVTYADGLRALRDAGAPDSAMVTFLRHSGMFGDKWNSKVDRIRADWEESR